MTILDRIVADTRELVSRRKVERPLSSLRDSPFFERATLSLAKALRKETISIIAEIKKASPSRGVIHPEFDVEQVASGYKTGGAAAISVLTEPFHFQGSLENLEIARKNVNLPLLRKDFIIDPYQVDEARSHGADVILLIASILDPSALIELHDCAKTLGLECLVEIHEAEELKQIDLDQVRIIGINNRDLRTFKVDLMHSIQIQKEIPEDIIRVSESGIETTKDIIQLSNNRFDAVLIGESLMRSKHPGAALSELKKELEAYYQKAVLSDNES